MLVVALLMACARRGGSRGEVRRAGDMPERTTGCVDTPFIAGSPGGPSPSIRCGGREKSPDTVILRGQVAVQDARGLPGPGLEGAWVSVHPVPEGEALRLDALAPARAEAEASIQGAFSLSFSGVGEHVVVVRLEPEGPVLAVRRVELRAGDLIDELILLVPADGLP